MHGPIVSLKQQGGRLDATMSPDADSVMRPDLHFAD